MPRATTADDLRALGYDIEAAHDGAGDVYVVYGFGVETYVREDDLEALAALADPAAHTERRFQHKHQDAAAAREQIVRKGYAVERSKPTEDVFDVVGDGVAELGKKPEELPPLAEDLPAVL